MNRDLTYLCLQLFNRHWVKRHRLIESWDVLLHLFQHFVWPFYLIGNAFKHIFCVEVLRTSSFLFRLWAFMRWGVSFIFAIPFLPSSITVMPFPITISRSIISIPTRISTQLWIVWTKPSSLICKEVHFLIVQCLKLCFFGVLSTNTHNIYTLQSTTHHIFRQ